MTERIYLDYAATTPLRPEAREAMEPWLAGGYGNPSSQHAEGRAAKAALDLAREHICEATGAEFAEVIFTSGATEAMNLALVGLALANESRRNRILFSAAEHHAVLHTAPLLSRLGYRVELLEVDAEAKLHPETLQAALGDDVLAVAAMHTNNEFGTVNPVLELQALVHEAGGLFVCDVVQVAPQKLKADLSDLDIRVMSAHKFGGPKGAGALLVKNGIKVKPLVAGGEQERERRGGTENVAGFVGMGVAVGLTQEPDPGALETFVAELPDVFVPTTKASHPKILHGRVPGLDAETVLIKLDRLGVAASSGAACSSGSVEPSHVLLAAGYGPQEAKEGLRFSFGPGVTPQLAKEAGSRVREALLSLKNRRS